MASPLIDTAIRADSTTTPNPCSDGGSWTITTGTWGILSNEIYRPSAGAGSLDGGSSGNFDALYRDLGQASCDVQVDSHRTGTSGDGLIVFAFSSVDGSYYRWRFDGSGDKVIERMNSSGTVLETVIADTATSVWAAGAATTLRVTYDSSSGVVTVYQNGAQKAQGTAGTKLTGTRVGVASKTTSGTADRFLNFSAYNLGDRPVPPVVLRPRLLIVNRAALARAARG